MALAVCTPLNAHPGRYPAHCPAEFGLSSPGCSRLRERNRQRPPGPPAMVSLPRKQVDGRACQMADNIPVLPIPLRSGSPKIFDGVSVDIASNFGGQEVSDIPGFSQFA